MVGCGHIKNTNNNQGYYGERFKLQSNHLKYHFVREFIMKISDQNS